MAKGMSGVGVGVAKLPVAQVGSISPAWLLTSEWGWSCTGIRLSRPARRRSGDGGRANVCWRNSSP